MLHWPFLGTMVSLETPFVLRANFELLILRNELWGDTACIVPARLDASSNRCFSRNSIWFLGVTDRRKFMFWRPSVIAIRRHSIVHIAHFGALFRWLYRASSLMCRRWRLLATGICQTCTSFLDEGLIRSVIVFGLVRVVRHQVVAIPTSVLGLLLTLRLCSWLVVIS